MSSTAATYGSLSGRRRVCAVSVACALVSDPKLVLADEPTANLDHDTAHRIIQLMKRLRDELGTTFVLSTHDPKIMAEAEITFLKEGRMTSNTAGGTANA